MALRAARIQVENELGTALEDVDVYTDAAVVTLDSDVLPQDNVKDALEAMSPILNVAAEAASIQPVTVLTHAKGEGTNVLTGLGDLTGLVPCSFKTTDEIYKGEPLTIDGTSYSLVLLTGETVSGSGAADGARMVIGTGVSVIAVADVSAKILTVQNNLADDLYLTFTAAGWTGDSAPYTQEIEASGVKLDLPAPRISRNITTDDADTAVAQTEAYAMIGRVAVVEDGTLRGYCYEEKPTVNVPILCQIVR